MGGGGSAFLAWIHSIIHSFYALKTRSRITLILHRTKQEEKAAFEMQTEEQSPTDRWDFQTDQMLSFR